MRDGRTTPQDAEAIAIQALAFIAADPERLAAFLAHTGLGPETLREAAAEPEFLSHVLDHLAMDESALLAFAANEGLTPAAVAGARAVLSGRAGHVD